MIERAAWTAEAELDWVCHYDDGTWSFHSSHDPNLVPADQFMVSCLEHAVDKWPQALALQVLSPGQAAVWHPDELIWHVINPEDPDGSAPSTDPPP